MQIVNKVYTVKVYLYEGGPQTIGTYDSLDTAKQQLAYEKEVWTGPNVETLDIVEVSVYGEVIE